MLSSWEASASQAGAIVARFLREYPGRSIQIDWSEGAILITVDRLDVAAEEVAFFDVETTHETLDKCALHAVS